jgi:hypothetical protein
MDNRSDTLPSGNSESAVTLATKSIGLINSGKRSLQ